MTTTMKIASCAEALAWVWFIFAGVLIAIFG